MAKEHFEEMVALASYRPIAVKTEENAERFVEWNEITKRFEQSSFLYKLTLDTVSRAMAGPRVKWSNRAPDPGEHVDRQWRYIADVF